MKTDLNITFSGAIPDQQDYFQLFLTTGWNDDYRIGSNELIVTLAKSWYWLCAYERQKLVGSGRIVSDGLLHAVIFDLIVLPDHQRKGIGTGLLQRLLKKCYSHCIRDIQLFSARGKSDFYIKQGFKPRPEDAPGMEIKKKYQKKNFHI